MNKMKAFVYIQYERVACMSINDLRGSIDVTITIVIYKLLSIYTDYMLTILLLYY